MCVCVISCFSRVCFHGEMGLPAAAALGEQAAAETEAGKPLASRTQAQAGIGLR